MACHQSWFNTEHRYRLFKVWVQRPGAETQNPDSRVYCVPATNQKISEIKTTGNYQSRKVEIQYE